MNFVNKIDHIAIAVRSIEASLPFYTEILGLELINIESIPQQKINAAYLRVGNIIIELMEPTDEKSFVARHLKKKGEGLAHICFETDSVAKLVDKFNSLDQILLTPQPVPGGEGRRVIFLHPKENSGTLTEFCEYACKHKKKSSEK